MPARTGLSSATITSRPASLPTLLLPIMQLHRQQAPICALMSAIRMPEPCGSGIMAVKNPGSTANSPSSGFLIRNIMLKNRRHMAGTPAMFNSQTAWIVTNRVSRNIVYVGQLGDCTEHGDAQPVESTRASTATYALENPGTTGMPQGIPYGVCVGNHDQSPNGSPTGTTTQ